MTGGSRWVNGPEVPTEVIVRYDVISYLPMLKELALVTAGA